MGAGVGVVGGWVWWGRSRGTLLYNKRGGGTPMGAYIWVRVVRACVRVCVREGRKVCSRCWGP